MAKQDRSAGTDINPQTFSAEGVEGYIPFIGPLKFVVQNFASGIKSGMSYTGAFNLPVLFFLLSNCEKKPSSFR
jgi:hypothetical protein